jgi:hypothetical protein
LTGDDRLIEALGQVNPEEKARNTADISFKWSLFWNLEEGQRKTYPPCA